MISTTTPGGIVISKVHHTNNQGRANTNESMNMSNLNMTNDCGSSLSPVSAGATLSGPFLFQS